MQMRTCCIHEQDVFILEHCFVSKWFAVVREFINTYPDKEVPNETTLVTTFLVDKRVREGCGQCRASAISSFVGSC
jgi:hypothetical protein